ncbi:MAG: hypothetical protein U0840_20215 [Gemmataceae bacterium]
MSNPVQRYRPRVERLEERAVPTFYSNQIVADGSGNFTATILTNQATLTVSYDGVADTLTLQDPNSSPLVIAGVTGNVNLTLFSSASANFLADLRFQGTFAGNYNVTVNQARAAFDADVDFDTPSGAATILGNVRITTNAAGDSDITPITSSPVQIVGNLSIHTNAGGPTARKSLNFGNNWTVRGSLWVPSITNFGMAAGNTVDGSTTIRTRAARALAQSVTITAGTSLHSLTLNLGDVSGTGTSSAALGGLVETFTTITMGANTGGPATNSLTLTGFVSLGSFIAITGKNGSKDVNIANVAGPLARLTVVLGNATDNHVDFLGANQFLFTTLVGGLGVNKVSGVIPSPNRVIRFTF